MQKIRVLATAISFLVLLTFATACTPVDYLMLRDRNESVTLPVERYVHPNPLVDRWHDTAIDAGWEESNWKWLSCVINRETGRTGRPDLRHRGGSARGLTQILYRVHAYWIIPEFGSDPSVLFDPYVNLFLAHQLFTLNGTRPWYLPHSC